jgi:hypothetical protein
MDSMKSSRMGIQSGDRRPDSGYPVRHNPDWRIRGQRNRGRYCSGRSFDRKSRCNSDSHYSDCRNFGFWDWHIPGYFADHIPDLVHMNTMRESGTNQRSRNNLASFMVDSLLREPTNNALSFHSE